MFTRLRLHTFIRGDHQQHRVDAAHAGQHILDKAFMTRNIDQRNPSVVR